MKDAATPDLSASMSSNEIPRKPLSAAVSRCQPPPLVRNAAQCEPRPTDASAIGRDRSCGRHKRELIGCAVADLKVMRGTRLQVCGHFDRDDQIASIKHVVTLGRAARKTMEICETESVVRPFFPVRSRSRP